MGNLGLQCDMQSCYLCDTCIYDEDLTVEKNKDENKTMAEKKFCNGCRKLDKLKISSAQSCYYNFYCKDNPSHGAKKLIDVSIPESKNVETPRWCPLCAHATPTQGSEGDLFKHKKMWHDLEPQVKFEDIAVGDVYHIPPYDGKTRKDIVITYRTEYSATYKVLGSNFNYIETLWPNTQMMRMLVKHKIQDIKVEKK